MSKWQLIFFSQSINGQHVIFCLFVAKESLMCLLKYLIPVWPGDKISKTTCAPSENSDQPGHPASLIWVFAVHLKKVWVFIKCTAKTDEAGWMPRLIKVFAEHMVHFDDYVVFQLIWYLRDRLLIKTRINFVWKVRRKEKSILLSEH